MLKASALWWRSGRLFSAGWWRSLPWLPCGRWLQFQSHQGRYGGKQCPFPPQQEGSEGSQVRHYVGPRRAFHGGSNCLFKWQVIPSKQITPKRGSAYVVFLQQTVSVWELLCLNRINFSHGRVKEGFRRVSIVSNIQNDLLGDGFAIPPGDRHARGVDSLDHFPVAVNRGFLVPISVTRIACGEALFQRQVRRRINNQSHRLIF